MDRAAGDKRRVVRLWTVVALLAGLIVSLPFVFGAFWLGWAAIDLPPPAGNLARAEMWQAAIFALGIAIGIIGSTVALACSSRRAKALGASGALLGLSCVVMGFVMASYLKDVTLSRGASRLRLVPPSMLILLSLAWFVNALRGEKKPPAPTQEAELTEERPQPLSPP